jgi:hypothetical protein
LGSYFEKKPIFGRESIASMGKLRHVSTTSPTSAGSFLYVKIADIFYFPAPVPTSKTSEREIDHNEIEELAITSCSAQIPTVDIAPSASFALS